jgi:hypothetical protein
MPKRKTSSGPQQLDCSDGAKMLIDQMKEHPEEFKGYAGKFTSILDKARTATQGGVTAMSKRDVIAIMDAAETHLYEVWLAEDVLTSIMQPKPEEEYKPWGTTTGRSSGKSVLDQMSGPQITNSVYSNGNVGASNTSTAQYIEQAYRVEQERYALKLERERYEQEEFKRREHEHAMRITKPFKDSI